MINFNEIGVGKMIIHNKKVAWSVFVVSMFLISGCITGYFSTTPLSTQSSELTPSDERTNDYHASETVVPSSTPLSISTQERVNTITPAHLTDTPVNSPSPTNRPLFDELTNMVSQCSQKVASFPSESQPSGYLVLHQNINDRYLNNLSNNTQSKLGIVNYGGHVSPDQKSIFYLECSTDPCTYVLATTEGTLANIPYSDEWGCSRWINSKQIECVHRKEPYNVIRILNPFDQTEKEITLNLPDPFYTDINNLHILEEALDASATKAIYFDKQGIGRIILWDLQTNDLLSWLPFPVPYQPYPSVAGLYEYGWSPDNTVFITSSPVGNSIASDDGNPATEELFMMSSDGKTKQLTTISGRYKLSRLDNMRWSPDGKYVAFWLRAGEKITDNIGDLPAQLIVMNMQTLELFNYCINSIVPYSLEWSPTSNQILISVIDKNLQSTLNILDIDLNQYTILPIQTNQPHPMAPEGWIAAP
jgi:hypothetical protein